jgi:Rod binding domain-containing protein
MDAPLASAVLAPVATSPPAGPQPKNVAEAAKQFEALLIGQMLKASHGDDEDGWLGSGDDPGSATAMELAEGQFAQALAQSGGLGLSARIASSLSQADHAATAPSEAPVLGGILHGGVRH